MKINSIINKNINKSRINVASSRGDVLIIMTDKYEFWNSENALVKLLNKLRIMIAVGMLSKKLHKIRSNGQSVVIYCTDKVLHERLHKHGIPCRYIDYKNIPSILKRRIIFDSLNIYYKIDSMGYEIPELNFIQPVHILEYLYAKNYISKTMLKKHIPNKILIQDSASIEFEVILTIKKIEKSKVSIIEPNWYSIIKLIFRHIFLYLLYKKHADWNLYEIPPKQNPLSEQNEPTFLLITPYSNYLKTSWKIVSQLRKKIRNSKIYIMSQEKSLKQYIRDRFTLRAKFSSGFNLQKLSSFILSLNPSSIEKSLSFINALDDETRNIARAIFKLYIPYPAIKRLNFEQKIFTEIITTIKPTIAFVGDDRGPGNVRLFVRTLEQSNIPVVEIQHGINLEDRPTGIPISTKVLVWGHRDKNILLSWGACRSQIEIIGNPMYDHICKMLHEPQCNNRKTYRILFVTQPVFPKFMLDSIKIICNYIQQKNLFAEVIVKPHPAEDITSYVHLSKKYPAILKVKTQNIQSLLLESDIVIVFTSTVGIEALLFEKPVITIAPIMHANVPYEEYVIPVWSYQQLVDKIESIISHYTEYVSQVKTKHKRFVCEFFYRLDCNATNRGVRVIETLLKRGDKQCKF